MTHATCGDCRHTSPCCIQGSAYGIDTPEGHIGPDEFASAGDVPGERSDQTAGAPKGAKVQEDGDGSLLVLEVPVQPCRIDAEPPQQPHRRPLLKAERLY